MPSIRKPGADDAPPDVWGARMTGSDRRLVAGTAVAMAVVMAALYAAGLFDRADAPRGVPRAGSSPELNAPPGPYPAAASATQPKPPTPALDTVDAASVRVVERPLESSSGGRAVPLTHLLPQDTVAASVEISPSGEVIVQLDARQAPASPPRAQRFLLPDAHPSEARLSPSGEVVLKQPPTHGHPDSQTAQRVPSNVRPEDLVILPDGGAAVKRYRGGTAP